MQEYNRTSTLVVQYLINITSSVFKAIFARMLKGKHTKQKYPEELKTFAITLHFYSPKGYEFVRKHFNLCFPSHPTIRNWCGKID